MRHTKAMHLLQSGVPLVMVKDFLGHVDLKSTEVYVQADLEMKRKALDLTGGLLATQPPHPRLSASLIDWLESLYGTHSIKKSLKSITAPAQWSAIRRPANTDAHDCSC
jgi:Phage integrase family